MNASDATPPLSRAPSATASTRADGDVATGSPADLGIDAFERYARIVDARSPHEFDDDHVPGAINLPVVDDVEFAEVGIRYKSDQHAAYLIGVAYALRNIAERIPTLIAQHGPHDRFLVYCFRGGKRSKLWADALRTIGFEVDVLAGGWKRYRRWVVASLATLPSRFTWRVLAGSTGCGKTRVLAALARAGEQVLDLEALACHRGSIIGDLPGVAQPTQKRFDGALLDALRRLDPARPVWVEAESKRIGRVQLPDALFDAIRGASTVVQMSAPMVERVRLWREDYAHFAADPVAMVERLAHLKPLVGGDTLATWQALAAGGDVDALFERVMVDHYDPCYARSLRHRRDVAPHEVPCALERLDAAALDAALPALLARLRLSE